MGLDQFATQIAGAAAHGLSSVGSTWGDPFERLTNPPHGTELEYWRKHPGLQGWMAQLWIEKGGGADPAGFNNFYVLLNEEDINRLETAILAGLPRTEGLFFGRMKNDEYRTTDLAFCASARDALERGSVVAYESNW